MYKYDYLVLKQLANTKKGKEFVEGVKECYEKNYLGKKASVLTYGYFKDFYRTGNRTLFQGEYFERRKRLMLLQVLALVSDNYLEDLEQILFEITSEFSWALPAHSFVHDGSLSYDYKCVDLYSSETSFYLAETAYVFKDKLSKDILDRINISIKTKVVDNFENGTFFFDRTTNNWAAVCCGAVGIAYLYAFPERFNIIKERIFKGMERFLSGIEDDGYCSEGFNYWIYGFGFFCMFFDVYTAMTGETPEILKTEKIKRCLEYGTASKLSGDRYLPFADGGTVGEHEPTMGACVIEQLFNAKYNTSNNFPLPNTKAIGFRALYSCVNEITNEIKVDNFKYYEKGEIYINKKQNYAFTAKGGYNKEKHNHNDIGVFHIVRGNDLIIADLGVGEYTKGYFGSDSEEGEGRYSKKVFVCSSLSHSVPIINGDTQKVGIEHKATVLESNEKTFKLDIKDAYVQKLNELIVEYTLEENKVIVNYKSSGAKTFTVRFVSVVEPIFKGDYLEINGAKCYSNSGIKPTVEKVEYNNQQSKKTCAYTIDYEILDANSVDQTFEIVI